MNPHPLQPPRRRVRTLAIIAAVFVALVAVGRYAPSAASPSAASSTSSSTSLASPIASCTIAGDAGPPPADAESAIADASEREAAALESLADGAIVVDLNRASEDDLRHLPGIGPVRARAIVALRARLGRLKGVDDLARIKGIGRAMLRRLRPLTRAS